MTRFEKLVSEAKKNVTEISPAEAAEKAKNGEAVIIDVREQDEWDEGHIPDAIHLSRGTVELEIEEKVPDPTQRSSVTAAAAVAQLSPLRACRRWATKTCVQWLED